MSYEHKVKIVPHGYLKNLLPEGIELSGFSVVEIINGLSKQYKTLAPMAGQGRHCVSIVGFNSVESLHNAINPKIKELHIVPEMGGGKSGGFFRVVVGAVLIAAAFYTGGLSLAGGPTLFGTTTLASVMFNFGTSLVLGGLLEMLSPAPKIDKAGVSGTSDPEASKYLGATQNTVRIGTRIPILYGEYQVYGHYISFDVDAKDVAV